MHDKLTICSETLCAWTRPERLVTVYEMTTALSYNTQNSFWVRLFSLRATTVRCKKKTGGKLGYNLNKMRSGTRKTSANMVAFSGSFFNINY